MAFWWAIRPPPSLPEGYTLPANRERGGLRPPQKNCFRFGVAALPPHQTENNRISVGLCPAEPVDGKKPRFRPHPDAIKVWVMHSPEGEGERGILAAHAVRVPPGRPPYTPAPCGGRGWGDSRDQSVCERYRKTGRSVTMSRPPIRFVCRTHPIGVGLSFIEEIYLWGDFCSVS